MLWAPTHSHGVQTERLLLCSARRRWRGNKGAVLHRWDKRYESMREVCVCLCARTHALVCVCLCVRINAQTRKKPAIPFANIDMGVPAQSCYKDYCLLRSHFIKLKHTPPAARRCRCRRFRHFFLPLAGVFGSRGETLGNSLAEDRRTQGCPVVIQSLLEAENAAVSASV